MLKNLKNFLTVHKGKILGEIYMKYLAPGLMLELKFLFYANTGGGGGELYGIQFNLGKLMADGAKFREFCKIYW